MQKRDSIVFVTIVREYIKNAMPISSQIVLEHSGLDLSSATIRSIMADLEEKGLIMQPHTSAGRIPTQAGYDLFIEKFLNEKILDDKLVSFLKKAVEDPDDKKEEYSKKTLAKAVAELSKLLVFVAFDHSDIYYTGISMLFSQPEFMQHHRIYDVSRVVDHMDDAISGLFGKFAGADVDVAILVGDRNPFHKECSSIIVPYEYDNKVGLIGLIGPMRMDYELNVALMKKFGELLKK